MRKKLEEKEKMDGGVFKSTTRYLMILIWKLYNIQLTLKWRIQRRYTDRSLCDWKKEEHKSDAQRKERPSLYVSSLDGELEDCPLVSSSHWKANSTQARLL